MDKYGKYDKLKQNISRLGNMAVAFSGGVDSTFLLKTAHDILRDKAIAVTARSSSFPERELKEAIAFCKNQGITHFFCDSEELDIEGFSENPVNRCYLCKNELFGKIWAIVRERKIENLAEGSNMDDSADYRPGFKAVAEQGVISPLRQAELTKQEIRELSKEEGLPTWNKQPFACLASRFPYGAKITPERLSMIDRAEQLLLDLGLRQVRVRHHGELARIETDENGFKILADKGQREKIYNAFRQYGFAYVSIDLLGYRTGSMNETLETYKDQS